MKEHNKRWLISMMKTSGSRRRHMMNGSYADDRAASKRGGRGEMPQREKIKSTGNFYGGKINYGPLVRFLRQQEGRDWGEVYADVIARIPTRLLAYKECVFWFVADKVEMVNGDVWNKKDHKIIWTSGPYDFSKQRKLFYVDPHSNLLIRVPDIPHNDNMPRKSRINRR